MLKPDDSHSLALLYHVNSEPWSNPAAFEEGIPDGAAKDLAGDAPPVPLERPTAAGALDRLLGSRSSCRVWACQPVTRAELAHVLVSMYGATRTIALDAGLEIEGRSAPSAGALYPLELYVLAQSVEGLAERLYHYNRLDHALVPLAAEITAAALSELFLVPQQLEGAGAVVFLAGVFERTLRKYGPRGYRYVLLEAGHVAQNACLGATELGLGSLCVGGFNDGRVNRFLGLDVRSEGVVYCIVIGRAG